VKSVKEIREIAKRVFNDSVKDVEDLKNEHNQYLKVMEGYKNAKSNTTKCKHLKAKTQDAFKPLDKNLAKIKSGLECAEIFCLECNSFIGYALRQIKKIPNQKPKTTILFFANNPNSYFEYKPQKT
jgi:hypothetical protein